MASFLSRLNTRTDGYGGTLPHRVRLPLDVLAAVRARVGPDYPVGIRYLGDEVVEGGSRVDDAVWFGIKFAEGGVDYLSVSKGGRFEDAKQPKIGEAVYPYTGEPGYECMPTVLSDARGPFGRNVPLAAAIRRALRDAGHATPVVTSGGITTFEQAEGILEPGGGGLRGGRAAVARRSRLVQKGPSRSGPPGSPLRVHELLRGARPAPQAGHVQALGPEARPDGADGEARERRQAPPLAAVVDPALGRLAPPRQTAPRRLGVGPPHRL